MFFKGRSFEVLFGSLEDVLGSESAFQQWEESLRGTIDSGCDEETRSKFWDLADTCAGENPRTAIGIARTNTISVGPSEAGLFLDVSRFNHSCNPNVHHAFQESEGLQVLRASCDIAAGDELCISYLSLLELCGPTEERMMRLSDRFGFDCDCQVCGNAAKSKVRGEESNRRRERLSQLCDAFAQPAEAETVTSDEEEKDHTSATDEPPAPLLLRLRARVPYDEEDEKSQAETEELEVVDMRDGLREASALLDQELSGSPAARALVFFGAFRRALSARRVSAARSLATAAWRSATAAEGPNSWRAQRLEAYAQDPLVFWQDRAGPAVEEEEDVT
ncbi:unnamed protein product [Polarella glacialis]|uniref:SET domain-containing protein n=1 Tax=Polarella glacialis TaxID=89957 RepID=A0A813I5N3_POLGL|nr:unnamed protein product [Polarella glacialis]